MLVEEGPLLKKNVPSTSTSRNRPTICLRRKRTSTATLHSARARRVRTWHGRRRWVRMRRTSWGSTICTATCGNGAKTRSSRTGGTRWAGAAAGATAAGSAGRRGALGTRRGHGSAAWASVLPEFPSGPSRVGRAEGTVAQPQPAIDCDEYQEWADLIEDLRTGVLDDYDFDTKPSWRGTQDRFLNVRRRRLLSEQSQGFLNKWPPVALALAR